MWDAYEVAVRLRLKDEFTGVMGLVNRHLMDANRHVGDLHARLEKVGKLFKAGALVTGAGFGMAMTLKAATNEAVKYEQQLNRLKALQLDARFGAGSTAMLQHQAQDIVRTTRGITSVDALKLVTEAQSITGNVEHTKELVPVLAKMRFAMETYMAGGGHGAGHGAQAERQFADIVKVMEMRGLMRNFTDKKLENMADLFVKNYAASGGMVKPSDFLALMKTGGVATKSVDQNFMFALGHIMQEAGGHRSGTMLMSLYQNMVAGRMPQQVAETLLKMGLLQAKHVHYGTTGHITKVDPGAMKNSALLIARPDQYMQQVILPALEKHGVDIHNRQAVLQTLNTMAGQRTSTNLLAQLYLEGSQIANYIQQAKGAMGLNAMYLQGGKSTIGQQIDLMAKVNQLELDFGKAALPLLKSALEQAIPLVKSLGTWMGEHPTALKDIAAGLGIIAASMTVAGPLMTVAATLRTISLVAPAITPIFTAFGALATGLAGIAGSVGYGIGTIAYKYLPESTRQTIGGTVANMVAKLDPLGFTDASSAVRGPVDQDAAQHDAKWRAQFDAMMRMRKHVQVHTHIHLDGRKIAQVVTEHQVAAGSRPSASQGGFDGSMAMRPVGAN